ncbi:MAG TPA: adenosylcobinamide amidohydrolase [Methylomirabilota bacterium]|jgi:iron complex transport system ATP-binding protein|nr:adenosylcobinamide amidohydrolase [Methylomirabilota bacterium]
MLEGVEVTVSAEAVVVTAARPLTVVSSAVAGGGFSRARSIVNVHVPKDFPWQDADVTLGAFARGRDLPAPWVGLLTAAWTQKAEIASESAGGVAAMVIATVGLGNLVAAGVSPAAVATPSTINTIVVVDADPAPAALVNLVVTLTEIKTMALAAASVRCADGAATGTSTDAVVVAATGRGERCRFGGPISTLGAVVGCAARRALSAGIERWLQEHR